MRKVISDLTTEQVINYLLGENSTFSERKSVRIAVRHIRSLQDRIVELENVIFALQSGETSNDEFNSVHPARRM